jgi:hypothetical protein
LAEPFEIICAKLLLHVLREYLGDHSRKELAEKLRRMEIEGIEKEVDESRWVCKPDDSLPVNTGQNLRNCEEMDANLKRRIESKGSTVLRYIVAREGPARAGPPPLLP